MTVDVSSCWYVENGDVSSCCYVVTGEVSCCRYVVTGDVSSYLIMLFDVSEYLCNHVVDVFRIDGTSYCLFIHV